VNWIFRKIRKNINVVISGQEIKGNASLPTVINPTVINPMVTNFTVTNPTVINPTEVSGLNRVSEVCKLSSI
jgi:hypothetical protein